MKIDQTQVKKVAKLANLPLTPGQEQIYSEQLSQILDYIEKLNSCETTDTKPSYNVTGLENVWSEDEVQPSLGQPEALKNAPHQNNGQFITKGIFEDE